MKKNVRSIRSYKKTSTIQVPATPLQVHNLFLHICTNMFLVPTESNKVFTGLVLFVVPPAVFMLVEAVFHVLITHDYRDDLGYYGQFHEGVRMIVKGILGIFDGIAVCFGRGEDGVESTPGLLCESSCRFYSLFTKICTGCDTFWQWDTQGWGENRIDTGWL